MARKASKEGALLELWRPAHKSGEPLGCLTTTYTFSPGLFDEQCLARFLAIESDPDREDLAFLLERESRLGGVYAGVLVDHTQAGVEHSLRWDVLPVRIRAAKQHAKLSLLAWSQRVRIVVASANLTEPGYRSNYEVAGAIDLTPEGADLEVAREAAAFLRDLLEFVPGAADEPPEVLRAAGFLDQVEQLIASWRPRPRGRAEQQRLSFNLPQSPRGAKARSALTGVLESCGRRGGAPARVSVASPFFDVGDEGGKVTAALCKSLSRTADRELQFWVPAAPEVGPKAGAKAPPRLQAPRSLLTAPGRYGTSVGIERLPQKDGDGNLRIWHAKMLRLEAPGYVALMIGSSNFTSAGLGVGFAGNAEANLLTLVDRDAHKAAAGQLAAIWPPENPVECPEDAEWIGASPELDEEEGAKAPPLPAGFLGATYFAGDERRVVLRFDVEKMPPSWAVYALGPVEVELLSAAAWEDLAQPPSPSFAWAPVESPRRLRVDWEEGQAFLPFNVSDSRALPPPSRLERMTAEEMLLVLAASDPSAAYRGWAKKQRTTETFDDELDSAEPAELDPLRRYDLQATFLHRIRTRARFLAQLRSNLERPVWSLQALEWRLRGLVGVEALADRFLRELERQTDRRDEALLALADFLIVLSEVSYQPLEAGAVGKREFEAIFRPFLGGLAAQLAESVARSSADSAEDLKQFWSRVEARCRS